MEDYLRTEIELRLNSIRYLETRAISEGQLNYLQGREDELVNLLLKMEEHDTNKTLAMMLLGRNVERELH